MTRPLLKCDAFVPFVTPMQERGRGLGLRRVGASALVAVSLLALAPRALAQAPEDAPGTPAPAPLGVSGSLANSFILRGHPSESTLLTVLTGSYAWTPNLSTFARVGAVYNASADVTSAAGVANPALGINVQLEVSKHLTVGATSGATLPLGTGGGNVPSPGAFRAWTNSIDWGGAMFAVDHVDVFNGVRAAFVEGHLTLSFESTLHELLRVRGEAIDPIGAAASVTGTMATVSYALHPRLALSTALSETRFWNTPDYIVQSPDSRVDYFYMAGASTSFKVGRTELTPAVMYARALDLPLRRQNFQVVELDLAFAL